MDPGPLRVRAEVREDGGVSTPEAGEFVQSFARGLSVIRAFDAQHPQLSLSEVARRADIARAAARRFLLTLEHLGYVRSNGRTFSLTPRVLELGFSYLSALSLPEIVQPHLESLSRQLDESVSAAVLDGTDIVYVARVATRRIMSVGITIGTRFPGYATSMGRVLLGALPPAELDQALADVQPVALTPWTVTDASALRTEIDGAHERGWALVDQELEPGLRSVAVPLRRRDGMIVAAVNVSTSVARTSRERVEDEYLPALRATAAAVETDLRMV